MNPLTDPRWRPRFRPVVNQRVRVIAFAVVPQPGRYELAPETSLSIVWMIRQPDSQKTASGVLFGSTNTGTNLPVDMLPLPCTGADKHNRHGSVGNIVVAYLLAYCGGLEAGIIYVSSVDRPVHDPLAHHAHEPLLVLNILFVKADEYFMLQSPACRHYHPRAINVSDGITSCHARTIVTTTGG